MRVYHIYTDSGRFRYLIPSDPKVASTRLLDLHGTTKLCDWPNVLHATEYNTTARAPDIYGIGGGTAELVIWGKAAQLLEPELQAYCEFLPVAWGAQAGHLINVCKLFDCLDDDNSEWDDEDDPMIPLKLAFVEAKIPSVPLFKIPEWEVGLFCTDKFKDFVKAQKLSGLLFKKVWAPGESIRGF
jgi:hypothetical protein